MSNTNEVCPLNLHNWQTFIKIFDELRVPIYGFCCRLLRDPEAAKDITQDLFIKLWTSRLVFEKRDNIRFYLFTMARNACLNELKKNQHQQFHNRFLPTDKYAEIPDTPLSLLARLEAEIFDTLRKTYQLLPPNEQYILYQSICKRKTNQEIASDLNVTERTVRRWKVNAIHKLRKIMENMNYPILLMVMLASACLYIIFL